MEDATGVTLEPSESRRNLLTRGVPLNDLVRIELTIGVVRLRGIRLCQPCKRLVRLTGHGDDLIPALVDRGGLRARMLTEGVIRCTMALRAGPCSCRSLFVPALGRLASGCKKHATRSLYPRSVAKWLRFFRASLRRMARARRDVM